MNASDYPPDWKEISHRIRFERAKGRCECTGECGLHKTAPGPRRCTEINGRLAKWARGKVMLTTAHLCKCDPLCGNEDHLKAMCNRCHLRVDMPHHRKHRLDNRRRPLAIGDLFEPCGDPRAVKN